MTIVNALPFNLQNGTTADATQVMADFNEIVNDVNNNAAHNGVNTDITALTALATPITPAQGGTNSFVGGTSTGSANAQMVAAPVPTGFTLSLGDRIVFTAGFTNTAAWQLNVNGTGLTNVFRPTPAGPVACTGGEAIVGNRVECEFDGTQFQILDSAALTGGFGAPTTVASASTVDLGLLPSHHALITGTTPITSLGSSAVAAYPVYLVLVNNNGLVFTQSATLQLIGSASITANGGDRALFYYAGAGTWIMLFYQRFNGQALTLPANSLQNYISGLQFSTAGSSGTFSITAGEANDATNASVMLLASAFTKTTSSWAVGTGNGGLDTGAAAINTWYHCFLMQRPDTGVVDICFSLSSTTPTTGGAIPAAYTLFRRIFSLRTNGSTQWIVATQSGDKFIWATSLTDFSSTTTASRVAQTLTVPTGLTNVFTALFRATLAPAGGSACQTLFTALAETDQAPSASFADLSAVASGTTSASFDRLIGNGSAQIGVRSTVATAGLTISTYGWIDPRGKL